MCADEDDDILPVKERASTYVHKLLSWRPQCLFGTTPDSEDEDEEKERQRIMEELDNLPLPKHDGGKYLMSNTLLRANTLFSTEILGNLCSVTD